MIEGLPVVARTEGRNLFKIGREVGNDIGVEIAVETAAKEEIACVFWQQPLSAKYSNTNGEVEIAETIETGGFFNKHNCEGAAASRPNWKAKYRPLQDETGTNKGKQIVIN